MHRPTGVYLRGGRGIKPRPRVPTASARASGRRLPVFPAMRRMPVPRRAVRRPGLLLPLGVAPAPPACRLTDVPLWGPPEPPPGTAFAVEAVRGAAYYVGPGADPA